MNSDVPSPTPDNTPPARSWEFDAVIVDEAKHRVLVHGVPQALEPKSFRLLQFLIAHRDRVVSKDEIFQTVWAGTFVTDNALTRAIAQVRKAIGDDHRNPRYIATIPTVGYRFVAELRESVAAPLSQAPVRRPPSRSRPIMLTGGLALVAALSAALWLWRRDPPAAPVADGTFVPVQFSSSSTLDVGASFSPDGTLIAYSSDRDGSFEIYVKSFDSTARELQLTSDGNQNLNPAFSPDGRWIAFSSMKRRGIFLVPAIGGSVQRLTDFGIEPVWSPDSQKVIFRSSGAASLSTTDFYWPAESNLWMVPVGGGEPQRIGDGTGELTGGQSFPSFTQDGRELRFVNYYKGESSVWTYTLSDARMRKIFASRTYPYSNATFSPDNTKMWFVNWQLNGEIGIWQQALAPDTLTPVGEPRAVYPSPFAVPRDLALSADGRRLAFTAALSNSSIIVHGPPGDATPPRSLTKDTTFRYALVRTSPDGTRVAYTSFVRNGLARTILANPDGSDPRTITAPADAEQFYPNVCTDGRVLVLQQRGSLGQLAAYRLADGGLQRLSDLPTGASQIAASPDCGLVVFHSNLEDRRQVYLQDASSGSRRVIAATAEDVGFGRFSRDGKWISVEVTHRPRGGDDIAVMPAGGGPLEIIMTADQSSFAAGWMNDNDRILFAGFRDGAWNVFTVSRTTRKVEQLTHLSSMRTYVRYPDWLVGDRIVFELNETKGNIFVATIKP